MYHPRSPTWRRNGWPSSTGLSRRGTSPSTVTARIANTVRASCLGDVDTCDMYVLILGHRYGSQPAGDNPEHLSITRMEYRRAGQSEIPRIALLRTSIPDVRLSDVKDPERLALVLAFRDEADREVRASEFSDLQGLIQKLSTGVDGVLGNGVARPPGAAAGTAADVLGGPEGTARRAGCPPGRSDGAHPRVAVLYGLGGTGKTSVAVEYAYRHLARGGGGPAVRGG